MELIIDPEFRDLIPPLTEEEYKGLEESILTKGFNPAFPIITWNGTIIDGHNRYGICVKNNVSFTTIEQEFPSRYDALAWIIDNQLARRNINPLTRNDLIGRRYSVEKYIVGANRYTIKSPQNEDAKRTGHKIADQVGVGHATVERAEKLSKAIDVITQNTGISRADILSGKIKGTQDDIKDLANCDKERMKRVIEIAIANDEPIKLSITRAEKEDYDRKMQEAEARRHQMESQLKAERDEAEARDREKLRVEHEERMRREREQLEKEKAEEEKKKLAEIERCKAEAEERAKSEADKERVRKETEELERIEMSKMEEHFKRLQELKQKKLDDQKRSEEERIKKSQIEKEKQDNEKIEKAVKVEVPVTPYDPYIACANKIMGGITLNACKKKGSLYTAGSDAYDDETTLNREWSGKVWLDILGAKSDSKIYIEKVMNGYQKGVISEAFVVARNDTGAEWFNKIAYAAKAVIFPLNGDLKNHALIYFGNNVDIFMKECEKFGWGIVLNN